MFTHIYSHFGAVSHNSAQEALAACSFSFCPRNAIPLICGASLTWPFEANDQRSDRHLPYSFQPHTNIRRSVTPFQCPHARAMIRPESDDIPPEVWSEITSHLNISELRGLVYLGNRTFAALAAHKRHIIGLI